MELESEFDIANWAIGSKETQFCWELSQKLRT